MHWQSKIKLLCWDLDGTLYPSNPNLKKHVTDLIIDSIALENNWTRKIAKEKLNQKVSKLKSTTKSLTALGVDGQQFFVNVWDNIDLSKYIDKNTLLAKKFSETKLINSIFTNSNTINNVNNKLNLIGINPSDFSFIMTSTQLGINKPDPKVFEAIIKKSKLKPEEIIYIGDRDLVDIIPATKIGMRTCMVNGTSDHADISLSSPLEVLNLFEGFGDNDK